MRFIELELAWLNRKATGGALIDGDAASGRFVTTELLGGDAGVWVGDCQPYPGELVSPVPTSATICPAPLRSSAREQRRYPSVRAAGPGTTLHEHPAPWKG